MSSVEDNSNENQSPKVGVGPGERLQAARIKKSLSLEDVATRMHLSPSILEAIEENNFDEITAPIFVKGYLRAYARIVALSEDEMIQQYIDFYSEEDPPISSTSNMAPELSVADARIKWTTYLVIVVLAVLLAAWWWNKQKNEEAPISLDAQSSSVDSSNVSETPVVDNDIQAGSEKESDTVSVVEPQSEPIVAEVSEPVEETDAVIQEEPVDEEAQAVSGELSDSSTSEVSEAVEVEEAVEVVEADADSSAEAQPPVAEESGSSEVAEEAGPGTRSQPERIAPTGSDKLRIIVHADTWADVKDASNYQLVYDLLRADSRVELSGEAPFVVFLGNGHGVEIEFNGDEVALSSRIRDDNTARLKIGD